MEELGIEGAYIEHVGSKRNKLDYSWYTGVKGAQMFIVVDLF